MFEVRNALLVGKYYSEEVRVLLLLPWVSFVRFCGQHPIGSNNRPPRTSDRLCIAFRIVARREIPFRCNRIGRDERLPRHRHYHRRDSSRGTRPTGTKRTRRFPAADRTSAGTFLPGVSSRSRRWPVPWPHLKRDLRRWERLRPRPILRYSDRRDRFEATPWCESQTSGQRNSSTCARKIGSRCARDGTVPVVRERARAGRTRRENGIGVHDIPKTPTMNLGASLASVWQVH